MYWDAQWRRNNEHEDQRLQVSNFVVAASVVAIGISASASANLGVLVVLAGVVAIANGLAYGYSVRSGQWARIHKHRADYVLSDNWAYFAEVQKFVYGEVREDRPSTPVPHSHDSWTRREVLQRLLHLLLIAGAIALPVVAIVAPAAEVTKVEVDAPGANQAVTVVVGTGPPSSSP